MADSNAQPIATWVWVHKGGSWPEGAVQGPTKYYYVARSKEHNTFGKSLPSPNYDPFSEGDAPHSAIGWFPFQKKEIAPDMFEVLVYRGDITDNGYQFNWVRLRDYLQDEDHHELYQDFDHCAVYEHCDELGVDKKRYAFASNMNEKLKRENKENSHRQRHAESWDDFYKQQKKLANTQPIGSLKLPSEARFTSLGKVIVLSQIAVENGYVMSINRVSKVLVEIVPDNIAPEMVCRKPSSFFEENYSTSFLPQEYVFRKMYKTVQRSEFQTEHGWEVGVTIEFDVGFFANVLANFKAENSTSVRGSYSTAKEETREEETEFTYPIKIPPYTSSCLTATIWEEQMDIPYSAHEVVYDQFNRVVHRRSTRGVWHGVSSFVANVVVRESFQRGFWIILLTVIFVLLKYIWD